MKKCKQNLVIYGIYIPIYDLADTYLFGFAGLWGVGGMLKLNFEFLNSLFDFWDCAWSWGWYKNKSMMVTKKEFESYDHKIKSESKKMQQCRFYGSHVDFNLTIRFLGGLKNVKFIVLNKTFKFNQAALKHRWNVE